MQQIIDNLFSRILRREEEYKRRTSVVVKSKPHFKCNTITTYSTNGVLTRKIVWSDGENLIMAEPNDSLTQEQLRVILEKRILRLALLKINSTR